MDKHNACETAWLNGYKTGRESMEKKGPIDVAIVVRCKDCACWNEDTLACKYLPRNEDGTRTAWYPDDFCSYGERK